MEVCLRVAQIEESSQGITAASHCSKGWWILNHLSNSSWTCGQDDFMAGWSLWGWKIKRDFLAPLPFFLTSHLLFSISTHQSRLHVQFFCCLSAAFIFILLCPYCTFSLDHLCGAQALWFHDQSSAALPGREITGGCPLGLSQSQLRNLNSLPTLSDWSPCPAAKWPVSMLRGHISYVTNLNIKTKSYCLQIQSCHSESADFFVGGVTAFVVVGFFSLK